MVKTPTTQWGFSAIIYYLWERPVIMKTLLTTLLCAIALIANSQCTTAPYGQWPTATYVPVIDDTWDLITSAAYNGEYSVISVIEGQHYQFLTFKTQNGSSRFLTITDEFDTPIVWGTTTSLYADSIGWTATFTGNIKFFTHLDAACGTSSANNQKASRYIRAVVPPPTNDEIAGAIELTINDPIGYKTYSNIGATDSSAEPIPSCANYVGGDVWFYIDVPAGVSVLDIDTQTGGITDGGMAVYRGTPGSLTLIECDDDDALDGLMPWIYREDFIPGERIYVRVWEYGGGTSGTFNIFVSTPQALPVELVSFEGANISEINFLEWETASEHNSDIFEIEWSVDGEFWRPIGDVKAAGNSTESIKYNFKHEDYEKGINYYRLIQIDYNGDSKVYGPIAIDNMEREKRIVRYVNTLGQEVNPLTTTGLVIEVYSDGTSSKVIR